MTGESQQHAPKPIPDMLGWPAEVSPEKRIVHSRSISRCCNAPQQLVQSRSGNFVTQDCIKCGTKAKTLPLSDIPQVPCPRCSTLLDVIYVGKDYGCQCPCGCTFELGSILPNWQDAGFKYCGVAAPGDF